MNYLAQSAREGLWTGVGLAALLWGGIFLAAVVIVAVAINPFLGIFIGAVILHWLAPHQCRGRCRLLRPSARRHKRLQA